MASKRETEETALDMPEIQAIVEDMACRRQHNKHASGYGMILVIDVEFEKKIEGEVEEQLLKWVFESLDRAHRTLDFDNAWKFVGNVRSDQWKDEEQLEADENRYEVCVHFNKSNHSCLPLFKYSNRGHNLVCPEAVLGHFDTTPAFVRGLAVSGVDETTLRDEWVECIRKEPNLLDRAGLGYMQHHMYSLHERAQSRPISDMYDIREQSFNFGWPEYPGDRGDEW